MNQLRNELAEGIVTSPVLQEGRWKTDFTLPSSFVGFNGHFPERPILPAVAQLLMGCVAAGCCCGKTLAIAGVANAKFMQPLEPETTMSVFCVPAGETWESVKFSVEANGVVAATFTLQLTLTGMK